MGVFAQGDAEGKEKQSRRYNDLKDRGRTRQNHLCNRQILAIEKTIVKGKSKM